MNSLRLVLILALTASIATPQKPETTIRGVRNGVTMGLGPATVAQGGILAVVGTELAAAHTRSEETPLPQSLEDPAVEVLINGVAAPLFFVSPEQINAQVPWETALGRASVVVRRGGENSVAMPLLVEGATPNLFTHEGSSSLIIQAVADPSTPPAGPAGDATPLALGGPSAVGAPARQVLEPTAEVAAGQTLSVFAAGIGQTMPAAVTGDVGWQAGITPNASQRAYLGGIPVSIVSTELSKEFVGVYELKFVVPELAGSGEVFRWYSGDSGGAGMLGMPAPPTARYIEIPSGTEPVRRIDMTDLNPYLVAASGALDEIDFCYKDVQLLDLRRGKSDTLANCVLPSTPLADSEAEYRPFEISRNSPVLAALGEPSQGLTAGVTDRLLLIDGASGSVTEVSLEEGTDRLRPGFGPSSNLALLQADSQTRHVLLDRDGQEVEEVDAVAPLPNPLEVDGLAMQVAQGGNFPSGYRMRFLASEGATDLSQTKSILFDRDANVVASVPFPEGWAPIAPPLRVGNQGVPVGNSLAPVHSGFEGGSTAYILARSSGGTSDAVLAFSAALPEDPEAPLPESIDVTSTVTPFPPGSYAATCTTQVRWQPIPVTRSIAVAAAGEQFSEFASPQANQICAADRLVLFDTASNGVRVISSPNKLDVLMKGSVRSYLYFGDGGRELALRVSETVHVFDGVSETFSEIAFPEGTGITINFTVQRLPGQARLVALATGGPLRTHPRTGATRPQIPGNQGLLVVDLPDGTATHLALPEGFQRVVPGPAQLVRAGRRGYGVIPLIGRAFAHARRPNAGPGQPGGSAMITWDVATGEATEIAMPEGGFAVVQAQVGGGRGGGGGAQAPFIWDYKPRGAAFAFGVYDRSGGMISVGVVGP